MLKSNSPINIDLSQQAGHYIVVGMGLTGLSCVRYLAANGQRTSVADSRDEPPGLAAFEAEFPDVVVERGRLDEKFLSTADYLIVSPGLSLSEPAIVAALAAGACLVSDIDLFALAVNQRRPAALGEPAVKIAAITGSNGKSTVASLLHAMVKQNGNTSSLCGNIGVPVLEVVDAQSSVFVIELSSFQLERSSALCPTVATVLNISADHMDRYVDLADYQSTKLAIYNNSQVAVYSREDLLTQPSSSCGATLSSIGFSFSEIAGGTLKNTDYGIVTSDNAQWIARGQAPLIAIAELRLAGRHNLLNAMAALAMGDALGLATNSMLDALREFSGLQHRCEWVADIRGVRYINDSKGTNTGATRAAIDGLATVGERSVLLIAGGVGKGADFSDLSISVKRAVKVAILFGRDANNIRDAIAEFTDIEVVSTVIEAVKAASRLAQAGDTVLFSPACASFDMFDNFEQRGSVFCQSVQSLKQAVA